MNVWDVKPEGKSDEQVAAEGLQKKWKLIWRNWALRCI